jgi:hypothetical protein
MDRPRRPNQPDFSPGSLRAQQLRQRVVQAAGQQRSNDRPEGLICACLLGPGRKGGNIDLAQRTPERLRVKGSSRRFVAEDASNAGTSLDLARCPWYLRLMIRSVRIVNRKHASRVCWAVEGVVR